MFSELKNDGGISNQNPFIKKNKNDKKHDQDQEIIDNLEYNDENDVQ